MIGGSERDEFIADAEAGQVFKGTLGARSIRFRYFNFGRYPIPDHFGPPTALFEAGSRYILFLRHNGENLKSLFLSGRWKLPWRQNRDQMLHWFPLYRLELLTSSSILFGRNHRQSEGARATTSVGPKRSSVRVRFLLWSPFLDSDDELVRFQAAWWMSFRRLNDSVLKVLVDTKNNPRISEATFRSRGSAKRHTRRQLGAKIAACYRIEPVIVNDCFCKDWSGRADLNCRPLAPQASALPG